MRKQKGLFIMTENIHPQVFMTITSTLSLPPYLYFLHQTHCFIITALLLFIAPLFAGCHLVRSCSFRSRKRALDEGPLFVIVKVREGLRGLRYVG